MTTLTQEWAPGMFTDASATQVAELLSLLDTYDRVLLDIEIGTILDWVYGDPYPGGAKKLIELLKRSVVQR